jgi:hypothetical protein
MKKLLKPSKPKTSTFTKSKSNFVNDLRVIELKGLLKLEKENNDENLYDRMRKSSKSKERPTKQKSSLMKE